MLGSWDPDWGIKGMKKAQRTDAGTWNQVVVCTPVVVPTMLATQRLSMLIRYSTACGGVGGRGTGTPEASFALPLELGLYGEMVESFFNPEFLPLATV